MVNNSRSRSAPLDEARVVDALFGNATRRILASCIGRARSAKEIGEETGLASATAYRRIRQLVADRLLVLERSAITPGGQRYDLFRSRVQAARIDLDASGIRVFWEPTDALEPRLARVWATLHGG